MTDKPWVNALNVNLKLYSRWNIEVPQGVDLTYWCLTQGKINEHQYLDWARDYYSLPSLTEEYFDLEPDHQFWQKISSIAAWSEKLIPLKEWDGVLFIACVEPPTDVPWSMAVQFLLAPATQMQKYWNQIQSPQHIQQMDPASIPFEPSAPQDHILEHTDQYLSQMTSELPHPQEIQKIPGLKTELEITHLQDLPPPTVTADSLFPQLPDETVATSANPEGLSLDFLKKENNSEAPHGMEIEPILSQLHPSEKLALVKNESNENLNINNLSTSQLPEPPQNLEDCHTENELIAFTFKQLKIKFQCSMILLFEGAKLRPWKWDKQWKPISPESLQSFDISKASIFRIVRRTKMPYHGYIVKNEPNESFFKDWGYAELPAHITISPLQYESHLVGMLLSIGTQEANTPNHLLHHEKTTFMLAQRLQKISSSSAA